MPVKFSMGVGKQTTVYQGDPSEAVDQAWEALYNGELTPISREVETRLNTEAVKITELLKSPSRKRYTSLTRPFQCRERKTTMLLGYPYFTSCTAWYVLFISHIDALLICLCPEYYSTRFQKRLL